MSIEYCVLPALSIQVLILSLAIFIKFDVCPMFTSSIIYTTCFICRAHLFLGYFVKHCLSRATVACEVLNVRWKLWQ